MDNKLDKLMDIVLEVRDQGIKNSTVLEEHARRSKASEDRVAIQEQKLEQTIKYFDNRLDPIDNKIKFISWLVMGVFALAPFIAAILGIIAYFRH